MGRALIARQETILLIATSESKLGDTNINTGAWAEELAEPYIELLKKGYIVDVASVAGGRIPIDPLSLQPPYNKNYNIKRFMADYDAQEAINNSLPIPLVDPDEYAAFFIVGGWGIAWDGPFNKELLALLETAYASNKLIAAIGHGPAALVNARNRKRGDPTEGRPLLYDKQVTGFSNREEKAMGRDALVPFLLEDKIREVGGLYTRGPVDMGAFAVRAGQLITGQNPASSRAIAQALVEALSFGVRLTP